MDRYISKEFTCTQKMWFLVCPSDKAYMTSYLSPPIIISVEVQDHKLKVYSDQPGLQLYTGNFLDGSYTGKDGKPIVKHGGLCLETQAWPNAVNNPQASDQVILKPGNTYRSKTVWVLQ